MANPLPPFEFTAPALAPAGFGLYDVATIVDMPQPGTNDPRVYGGVHIRPVNCSQAFGTWPTDPCAAPPRDTTKHGDRPTSNLVFEPVQVWAYDECDPQGTDEESQALALQTLRLQERLLVESAFAAVLLAQAGAAGAATTLVDAVGSLEETVGEWGYTGVIHAARRWAAVAADDEQAKLIGSDLRTLLGNRWAFGGGYASVLADTLVATGPIYMWRYAPFVQTALDPSINRRASIAEQLIVVGFECAAAAVTIS